MSMEPTAPGNYPTLMTLIGILTHPLLILSPVMLFRKYLHRIPETYAVFFTSLISLFVLVALGALQGDLGYVKPDDVLFIWQAIGTIVKDLLVASVVFGMFVFLDSFFPGNNEHST